MSRIRIGVVGCGLIGQMMHLPHLKELHELYEVVALCDVSPGTLQYVGDYYGIARRHSDHRELLKEKIDAVMVLSADSHGQVIVDALRAKKHVVTEKPMCFAMSEADEILAAHRAAGTVCMVTYMKRYDPPTGTSSRSSAGSAISRPSRSPCSTPPRRTRSGTTTSGASPTSRRRCASASGPSRTG